ncbi:YEATS domain-containing protein 4-like [Amblyomma americanum]
MAVVMPGIISEIVQEPGGRMKGLTIVKPIVYGNVARYFGKKREDGHTHQWTVYLKPYRNEDMSSYVQKVHFKLHESYPNQNRLMVTKPPYEVTETGWGEFEIVIKIYFMDTTERPVTVYHILKLFQSETNIMLVKKQLVSESYDELIFSEPTVIMHQHLTNTRPLSVGPYKHEFDFKEWKEKTLDSILSAKNKIRLEVADLKERLKVARETIGKYKAEVAKLESQDDADTGGGAVAPSAAS